MSKIKISAIMPCRNEKEVIHNILESLVNQTISPDEFELLIIDGSSTDGTREILNHYQEQYPFIKIIDNPQRITPIAFNLGIKASKGDFIVILSAHCTYPYFYIENCLKRAKEACIENVGGYINTIPRSTDIIAKAITFVTSHRFGVGNSDFRTVKPTKPIDSDTSAFGCYPRSLFDKIGFFNENLLRSQDSEFNRRVLKNGGTIRIYPDIHCDYYSHTKFPAFCHRNFINGLWIILPIIWTDNAASVRHLVPLTFVLYLSIGAIIAGTIKPLLLPYVTLLLLYLALTLLSSIQIGLKNKAFVYSFLCCPLFVILHITYGVGSLVGIIKVITHPNFYKKTFTKRK